ncbi:family 20 glycosylhydrolase [Humibacter ginsenosidimutans]|uniref:beta-N-acetylhexosaminidase n=1 Tax=Humibacter ginsenosidimutans TaxID=2599293 RepID=A0A5B8M6Y2_9MICO|nr:family 20 glycosylhydrolase [Humibacter ginsenosidimutans]QDZ15991.1 family 20 glycosylhydrolase [Humibacter ginsenosidimutans]
MWVRLRAGAALVALVSATLVTLTVGGAPASGATPGEDVALQSNGGVATAASSFPNTDGSQPNPSFVATNANDGDDSTRWGSEYTHASNPKLTYDPTNDWLQIKLASPQPIDHVVLKWESAYASQFQIQGSTDGSTWTTLKEITNATGGVESIPIGSTTKYSYVRMQGEKTATSYGYSIYTFQVWNGPEPAVQATLPVVPTVKKWAPGTGTFSVPQGGTVAIAGSSPDQNELQDIAKSMEGDLATMGAPAMTTSSSGSGTIVLAIDATMPAGQYTLAVSGTGVTLTGNDSDAVFDGTQTLEQLLATAADRATLPIGTVTDSPTQQHRGVMVDTARKYWTIASLEQLIRQMAWLKLDYLHWHITDSEYFRLSLPGYTDLAAKQSYDQADIQTIENYAAQYHVTVEPEVDLPGHSTAMTAVHNDLRWDCSSMNKMISSGNPDPGFTVDITKPANVAYLDGLVTEVAKSFSSPIIHLGGDETPQTDLQSACPELQDYATAQGYSKTEDVFLAFENHMDDLLKSQGKTMEMWGWWPQAGGAGSVTPNKDILIQAWLGDEQANFISKGYDVVVSNEKSLMYVVPKYSPGTANGTYSPNDQSLYQSYSAPTGSQVAGLELAEWGDNAYQMPDAYPLSFMERPMQVLAAVAWGSPRLSSYLDYEQNVDAVGSAPGVLGVEPGTTVATGTATGTAGSSAAVDGNTATAWTASANGAWVGIDRGADAVGNVVGARVLPTNNSSLSSLVGSQIQGCTTGPDTGCTTLATLTWTPTWDWDLYNLSSTGDYRWLRLLGASGAKPSLAELQFLQEPQTDVGVSASASAAAVAPGDSVTVTATVANSGGSSAAYTVSARPVNTLNNTQLDAGSAQTVTVAAGGTAQATFSVHVPASAAPGEYIAQVTAISAGSATAVATANTGFSVGYSSLVSAYDNVGVTSDDNPEPGDLDGAQSSLSATALSAQGITPGSIITTSNGSYRASWDLIGTPDDALASGQTIPLSGSSSSVSLLTTGTYSPKAGSVTLHYADGTSATSTLSVLDWSSVAALPSGTVLAVNAGVVNANRRAQTTKTANLYSIAVPADPTKQLASITLPAGPAYTQASGPAIHVFAISTNEPADDLTGTTESAPVTLSAAGDVILDSPSTTDGTWSAKGSSVTFTPNPGFDGTADALYQTVDANNGVSTAGKVSVVVTAPAAPLPAITSLDPDRGPETGGTLVTISGTGFDNATGVTFGGIRGSAFTKVSDTKITVTAPMHVPGTVDVLVESQGGALVPTGPTRSALAEDALDAGQSGAASFTYFAVTSVGSVTPATGTSAGGTKVTIRGACFTGATKVLFGTRTATSFVVVDDSTITAVTPAGTGKVDVTVKGAGECGTSTLPAAFSYLTAGQVVASTLAETGSTVSSVMVGLSVLGMLVGGIVVLLSRRRRNA